MTAQQLDGFIAELQASAEQEYMATAQYTRFREKLAQMHRDCDTMFTAEDSAFARECFALLQEANDVQRAYVFRQAFRDCAFLLRRVMA